MNFKINLQTLNQLSVIYCALPLIIFLLTWLKPYIALTTFVVFSYALYIGYFKGNEVAFNKLVDNRKLILILLLISLLWCYLAGIGCCWYQSEDYNWRNAIFRDLITHSWPLYYDTMNAALVYYIGYWLPAAIFAKIFLCISEEVAFWIGNSFLLIYSSFGILLVFMHLLKTVKIKKYYYLIILAFIFFSGMDIIGLLFSMDSLRIEIAFITMHLEWWSIEQYSSFTSVLFWVFNQGIFAWLTTLMFYNNKNKVENFGIIAVLCLFYAPLPFIGLFVFLLAYITKILYHGYKRKQVKKYVIKIFSVQNCITTFFVTSIICLYFISNHSIEINGVINLISESDIDFIKNIFGSNFFSATFFFLVLEVGIYFFLIFKQYNRNIIFYITLISLILCPFIRIGYDDDFCMRGSIPALLILFIIIIKFLCNSSNFKRNKIRYIALLCCLIFGCVTPTIEFARGIIFVAKKHSVFLLEDNIKTFEKKIFYDTYSHEAYYLNFITIDPKRKIFFKYLAKK